MLLTRLGGPSSHLVGLRHTPLAPLPLRCMDKVLRTFLARNERGWVMIFDLDVSTKLHFHLPYLPPTPPYKVHTSLHSFLPSFPLDLSREECPDRASAASKEQHNVRGRLQSTKYTPLLMSPTIMNAITFTCMLGCWLRTKAEHTYTWNRSILPFRYPGVVGCTQYY